MQITADEANPTYSDANENVQPLQLGISLEGAIYIGLFVVALLVRVLGLDIAPLDNSQAHEALAALRRVDGNVPGDPLTATYPLMAFVNQFLFIFLGSSDAVARLATAIAGSLLVISPVLLRQYLGRITTVLMIILLMVSPIAIISSRTMGGVTWTMLVLAFAMWCLTRFVDTQDKSYGIATILSFGTIMFLTEPTGLITLASVMIALFIVTPVKQTANVVRTLPWGEGLIATLGVLLVVGTGFFTAPGGLSAVGNTIFELFENGFNTDLERPPFFALLVVLRYEFGILLLGLIAVVPALIGSNNKARFFAIWFLISLLVSVLYQNPAPDAALWLVIPGIGLTASLLTQFMSPVSTGFWIVPRWAIPLHAVLTASLLIGMGVNTIILSRSVQQESQVLGIERIETDIMTSAGKIGAVNNVSLENTMQLTTPVYESGEQFEVPMTIQIEPITDDMVPQLIVTNNVGDVLFGPYVGTEDDNTIIADVSVTTGGIDYFFKVSHVGEPLDEDAQFMLLTYAEDAETIRSVFEDFPIPLLLFRITPTARLTPAVVLPFLILLTIVLVFLFASLWGNRPAWRGFVLGIAGYFVLFGIGWGWQVSTNYATNPNEFWYEDHVTYRYDDMADTLRQLSLQSNGEPDKLEITIQGDDDTALAWLVRDFENTTFVAQTGIETDSEIIIMPVIQPEPTLGADYIGQDFVFSRDWDESNLSWTDFFAWISTRETRVPASDEDVYMLWARNDIYRVEQVIPTE